MNGKWGRFYLGFVRDKFVVDDIVIRRDLFEKGIISRRENMDGFFDDCLEVRKLLCFGIFDGRGNDFLGNGFVDFLLEFLVNWWMGINVEYESVDGGGRGVGFGYNL